MKRCCVIYNIEKREALGFYEGVLKFLETKDVKILPLDEIQNIDFVIIIGGDGTLLRASKKIIENPAADVIAINAGSLGFLTEIKMEDGLQVIERYLEGECEVRSRYLLEVKFRDKCYNALNEVVISKGGAMTKMLRVGLESNGEYMNTYRADGLIISTPTGSTAYSMAAGGPIVSPWLNAMIITPIAAHNLTAKPIVIDGSEKLSVRIEDEGRTGYAILDGEKCAKIGCADVVEINYSDRRINLVLPEKISYYGILRETLKWGDKIC